MSNQEVEPHILRKFQILQRVGKGAYGIVWKAIDKKTNQLVALKKVFDAFHNKTDAQRTFRQVMFLQQLLGHQNIISLHNVIRAQNNKDLYLVFDFMDTDLHAVIRANILLQVHKQFVVYQMLKAMKYIHSADLIHRDLKPSNLLLNSQCLVKVADFGLARSVSYSNQNGSQPILTEYVATRWYRAPQILLGSTKYTKSVDMWSVGCIVGQLIVGKAIFPGNSTLNQIQKIIDLLGRPKAEDLVDIDSNLAQNIINNMINNKKNSFSSFFSGASQQAIDLIRRLLVFNPKHRLTVDQALKHPYVKDFACAEQEINCPKIIEILMNDNKKYSIRQYREAIYNEIMKRRKDQMREIYQKKEDQEKKKFSKENREKQLEKDRKKEEKSKEKKQFKEIVNNGTGTVVSHGRGNRKSSCQKKRTFNNTQYQTNYLLHQYQMNYGNLNSRNTNNSFKRKQFR